MFSEPAVIESPSANNRIRRLRSGLLVVVTGVLVVWLFDVPDGVLFVVVVPELVLPVPVAPVPVELVPVVLVVPVLVVLVPVLAVFELEAPEVLLLDVDALLEVRAVAPVLVSAATDTTGATVGLVTVVPDVVPAVEAALAAASVLDAPVLAAVAPVDAAVASLSPDPQAARAAAKIEQNSVFWSLLVRCFIGVGLLIRGCNDDRFGAVKTTRELLVDVP